MLAAGDAACYAAKAGGRNRVEVFEPHVHRKRRYDQSSPRRARMEQALVGNSLLFFVQPFDANLGHELPLLIELSAALPGEEGSAPVPLSCVMEDAERFELAQIFDQHLVGQAVALLPQTDKCLILVRLAAGSVRCEAFADFLTTTLQYLGEQAQRLCFVVSEEVALQHPANMERFCDVLRAHRCVIGLDDFGGWMGSFQHLQDIRPGLVRVTQTLTREIADHRSSQPLIKAIQEVARDQAIHTAALGIDRLEDRHCLAQLGLDYLQGDCLQQAKPLEHWLATI